MNCASASGRIIARAAAPAFDSLVSVIAALIPTSTSWAPAGVMYCLARLLPVVHVHVDLICRDARSNRVRPADSLALR